MEKAYDSLDYGLDSKDHFFTHHPPTPNEKEFKDFELFSDNFSEDSGNDSTSGNLHSIEKSLSPLQSLSEPDHALLSPASQSPQSFLIKTASDKDDAFSSNFPTQMYTYPHKYDMKIFGLFSNPISIELVYENEESLRVDDKKPLEVHQVNGISSELRLIRFSLNTCSFHHHKRKFRIRILCEGRLLFLSCPFQVFARRRGKKKTKVMKAVSACLQQTPQVTPSANFPTVDNLLSQVQLAQKKSLILQLMQTLPQKDRQQIIQLCRMHSTKQM